MAKTFIEDFEGIAAGTALDETNTSFSARGGVAAIEADTTDAAKGGVSALVTVADTSENGALLHDIGVLVDLRFWRWYYSPDSLPAGNQMVAALDAGGSFLAEVRQNADGTLSIREGFVAVATSTTTLAAGDQARLEWSVDATAGTNTLRIFVGGNVDGATPDETISSAAYAEGDYSQFRVGIVTSGNVWSAHFDGVEGDDADWVGPAADTDPDEKLREDFERLGDGTVVTDVNTAFDEVLIDSPHTLVADTGWSVTGGTSAHLTFGGSAGACKLTDIYAQENVTRYIRFYARFDSLPGAFDRIFTAEDSVVDVNVSVLTFDTDDRIRITFDPTTEAQASISARQFAAGDEVRIEVFIDPVGGSQSARLYYSDIHAAVGSYDEEISTALGDGVPDDFEVGSFNDNTWSMHVDSVVMRTDRWVGPEGVGTTVAIGQAADVDEAPAVTLGRTASIGQAVDVDEARPVTVGDVVVIDQVVEVETADARPCRQVDLGRVFTGDHAFAVTVDRSVTVGLATETDTAIGVTVVLAAGQIVAVGGVTEVDTALALRVVRAPKPPRVVPFRTRWQFVLGPADGGFTSSLTEAKSRRLVFRLTPQSEASFRIDGRHPQASEITELASDVHVLWMPRDGPTQILYRGRVGATGDDVGADNHEVEVQTLDYRALLERRLLWSDSKLSWTGVEQAQIAWELIQQTQQRVGGDLGISRGVGTTTGRVRDRNYEPGDSIGQRIQELSEVIDGFDWDITPVGQSALHLDIFYPSRGADRGVVLEYGGLAQTVRREVDPGEYANAVQVTGDENASTPPTPEEREADDLADRPEGRWDRVYSYPTIKLQSTLDERADYQISVADIIAPSYTIGLRQGAWEGPQHIWVGDAVRIVVQSGRLNVDTRLRVTEVQIDIPDDGQETVTLTAAVPSPSPFVPRSTSGAPLTDRAGRARRVGGGRAFLFDWLSLKRRVADLERR